MRRFPRRIALLLFCSSAAIAKGRFPQTYTSCGLSSQLTKTPSRAMSIDINTTEIMLKLGLASRMIAVAGVESRDDILPELRAEFDKIAKINAAYPSLETVLGLRPDFLFAGWQYGFSESTGLTPKRLGKFGIAAYALKESCIRVQRRPQVSLDDVFDDIQTISRIFDVSNRGEALIRQFRQDLKDIAKAPRRKNPARVFLYDSGEASPVTAGRFAIPNAMIEAVGAKNVFDDLMSSWTSVNWEDVIARKPDFVIVVDYGDGNAAQKVRFLEEKFRGKTIDAMERKHYIVLPYAAVTPGIRSIAAAGDLLKALASAFPHTGV